MKSRGLEELLSTPSLQCVFCAPLGLSAGVSPSIGLYFYGTIQSLGKCEDILGTLRVK